MSPNRTNFARAAIVLSLSVAALWQLPLAHAGQADQQRAQYMQDIKQILNDKAGYAEKIVQRWEAAARQSGRWDERWHKDLTDALSNLSPDNLLAANKAETFETMMAVLAQGPQAVTAKPASSAAASTLQAQDTVIAPLALGSFSSDLVYTPVTPCRIVDTRNAGGPIPINTQRTFDMDGSDFSAQGGFAGPCGIPFGVATAVAMTITATQPTTGGNFRAWALGAAPVATVLNFAAGQTVANTTIVPVSPGGGADFTIASSATSHVVVAVVGYFSAPIATALDCIQVSSAVTVVAVNVWTNVDVACPAGRTVTGGGHYVPEGTLGRPGVWTDALPNGNGWRTWVDNQTNGGRSVQTFAMCCRIPGR